MRARHAITAAFASLVLASGHAAQEQETSEFSAHGFDVVRIENEAKLHVPFEIGEEVWTYLNEKYADPSFLDRDGHRFTATFGDEDFSDTYYDLPDLTLLGWKSGIRHRSRVVKSGSAMRKDGRQLLQLKLNREDATGLRRSEIKFEIDSSLIPPGSVNAGSPIALVTADQRAEATQRIGELGIDPNALRPVVTLLQNRRRVYVADQHGAIATISHDDVTCSDWGVDVRFFELELELNEIRYTEAAQAERAWMEALQASIQQDIVARFPSITQNQTPKYNKAFEAIDRSNWLPLQRMVGWGLGWDDALLGMLLIGLGSVGGVGYLFKSWFARRGVHGSSA